MKLVFFGTADFAVPALNALAQANFDIVSIVTLPDRKQGRELKSIPSPVAVRAEVLKLPILKQEKISSNEFYNALCALQAEIAVVTAYGKLIPESIIKLFPKGIVNVHPSLLPELRGSSPVQSAILTNKKYTGVTIMLLDKELDHGPMLAQIKEPVTPDDTSKTLGTRLATIGAKLLISALTGWTSGKITPLEQDHKQATFTSLIEKKDGKIDWQEPAEIIERKIRAYAPWPGVFTFVKIDKKDKRLKIIRAKAKKENPVPARKIGELFTQNNNPAIATPDGVLELLEVQIEGENIISGASFLNGYGKIIGSMLN